MKEVDRIIEASTEDAFLMREQWRKEIHTSDHRSVAVPRLDDYATSWMKIQDARGQAVDGEDVRGDP